MNKDRVIQQVDSMLFSPKDNVNDPAIPIRLTMDTLIDDMCNNSVQLIELSKNLNDGFINLVSTNKFYIYFIQITDGSANRQFVSYCA